MMKKKVYICAPLGGDVQGDLEKRRDSPNMRWNAALLRSCRISMRSASMTILQASVKSGFPQG